MAGGVTFNPEDLKTFRDNLNDLLTAIRGDTVLTEHLNSVAPGPVDFGEHIAGFDSAQDLAGLYNDQYTGFQKNFESFKSALEVLAEAADRIATNYENAANADAVSAQSVDDAFDTAPVSQPQAQAQTQTTTQSTS
ncbi:hypothetical protein [Rugosimonospora africana]|uniref:Uncharacterized protein n=1 Tax=Rugosimonospora africana TaxID=556532 RepID=A0A8J3R282_9ACTN|nr:hypothetical protein [Rugosimonospora africana]GIH18846.1 hypothetical protein Raf01_70180 [Rugosimonospora africana]